MEVGKWQIEIIIEHGMKMTKENYQKSKWQWEVATKISKGNAYGIINIMGNINGI